MAQVMVNFRIDSEVKQEMEKVCRGIGLSPSVAYNVFARKVAREKRIPFELNYDPFYSESNMKALDRSLQQIDEGKVVVKTMDELRAMEV